MEIPMSVLAAVLACFLIHLLTIAAAGQALGVTVRTVALGMGPALGKFGMFELRWLPIGGSVTFRDSRIAPVPAEAMKSAFDGRSATEQMFVCLSGCAMLLLVADVATDSAIFPAFAKVPAQVLAGAMSPLGDAQALLHRAADASGALPFMTLLALVAVKLAGLNLLPLPALNGGAVLAVLGHATGLVRWWPVALTRALIFFHIALLASWSVALCTFLVA
jgi:membrane-associated protease RseP (regulator of RpoE activity)